MISLTTHATRNWLPRLAPYLDSLAAHWPAPVNVLVVDGAAPAEFAERWPAVTFTSVPTVPGAPEGTHSLQHGAFIEYVQGDILIYTDGDIVMQRPPTLAELDAFAGLGENEVYCGWNSGPDETLVIEAQRLFPRCSIGELALRFGEVVYDAPCYNIGVIAARRATWARLWEAYLRHYPAALEAFGAQQRQQWLVCYVLRRFGFDVRLMPYTVHLHGCYALPPSARWEGGAVTLDGTPVLFRHHL